MTIAGNEPAASRETSFIDGWTFRSMDGGSEQHVTLPHDAMIAEPRTATAATGNHGAYFAGGRYLYTKRWTVPADAADRLLSLRFEGVYGDTVVRVNGQDATCWDSGYREVIVPLTPFVNAGEDSIIEVHVDNTRTPNSRWYTGSGIYRPVTLLDVPATHIVQDSVHVVTRQARPEWATVDVSFEVDNAAPELRGRIQLLDASGEVASTADVQVLNGSAFTTLRVPQPQLWSAESPALYHITLQLIAEGRVADELVERVGLRTISVDAQRGLQINGHRVLLRGACIHHDNGVLGAATHTDAEWRRARILKKNGFNAVRSSHNPLSRAFLDACDVLGLYVMDELTDVWFQAKTKYDGASRFDDEWRDDAVALIRKDQNRPSVIMYSIGNENAETATDRGVTTTAALADFFAEKDPERPTTLAINFLLNFMASFGTSPFRTDNDKISEPRKKETKATSTAVNALAASIGPIMQQIPRLPRADKFTRDALARVDIAGYNYAYLRYRPDRKRYPNRVILGTESMPGDIVKIWKLVERVPGVIGDFMWTGWDYLGEAGIGVWGYDQDGAGIGAAFPALLAGPGVIDVVGLPGPAALLARAVWGELDNPEIAVRPLDRAGQRVRVTPWRVSDALQSWSWAGHEGKTAQVEVYSDDAEVELLLNSRSLGRKQAGESADYVTRFTVPYEPGTLTAISYRDGVARGQSQLTSAGPAQVTLRLEPSSDSADLVFVWVELADTEGVVDTSARDAVTLEVSGGGTLVGFGSAAPSGNESFADDVHDTFYGRALAVIRRTGSGPINISATGRRYGTAAATAPAPAPNLQQQQQQ